MKLYHRHHKLSQTKVYRKIYGKLLDEPFNIEILDTDTHLNKPITKYTEKEFRKEAMRLGYELPESSKTLKIKTIGER